MSSAVKLLPCPFCGGKAILDKEDIFCGQCYLSMKIDDRLYNREAENYDEARTQTIETWNTRKPMDSIVEQLEEAKERSNRHYNYGEETAYRHAIEIVRLGGK
jgi:hypothetical protein